MVKGQSKRLSASQKRLFMAIVLRNDVVFGHFREKLTVLHFKDESYQLLYRALLDHSDAHSILPTLPELEANITAMFEEDPEVISEYGREDLEDLLAYAYDPETWGDTEPSSKKMERYGFKCGQKILQTYHADQAMVELEDAKTMTALQPYLPSLRSSKRFCLTKAGNPAAVEYSAKTGTRTQRCESAPQASTSLTNTCQAVRHLARAMV